MRQDQFVTLPSKSEKTKPAIIIKFISKHDLLMQARKPKGSNVYINGHLMKKNKDIAREARMLRKQKKNHSYEDKKWMHMDQRTRKFTCQDDKRHEGFGTIQKRINTQV